MQNLTEKAASKDFLRSIADNDYTIPEEIDLFAFANALMLNLASVDEELRDDLSYMILASGIIGRGKLTTEQLQELLLSALNDKHLFFQIGEHGTDSVFMRSFSNLIVAAILYHDTNNPALGIDVILQAKTALLRYAHEEKDWRGYLPEKGWVHTLVHLADALDEAAQNQYMTEDDRKEIMTEVCALAKLPEPQYNDEDVHLATVAYHIILGKQVDEEFISSWIDSCAVRREPDVVSWRQATNAKNFLRSLYFFLVWDGVGQVLSVQISTILKQQEEVYIEKEIVG